MNNEAAERQRAIQMNLDLPIPLSLSLSTHVWCAPKKQHDFSRHLGKMNIIMISLGLLWYIFGILKILSRDQTTNNWLKCETPLEYGWSLDGQPLPPPSSAFVL